MRLISSLTTPSRQDHDVDRRGVREPEQVLKEDRIPSHGRIEDSDMENSLKSNERQADRQAGVPRI